MFTLGFAPLFRCQLSEKAMRMFGCSGFTGIMQLFDEPEQAGFFFAKVLFADTSNSGAVELFGLKDVSLRNDFFISGPMMRP